MSGIYIITMGKYFYIGRTNNFTKRKSKHLRDLEKGVHTNRRMQMTFKKYNRGGFNFNVVFKIEDESLLESVEQKLLNEFIGYDNCMNYNPSASSCAMYGIDNYQARAIIQIDENGSIVAEYDYIRQAKGFEPTNIVKCCKGKMNSHKGFYWMYKDDFEKNGFHINKYHKPSKHKRKVVQLDMNDNVVKTFDTIVSVAEDGFEPKLVTPVCQGKRKSHKGFKWMYLEEL